MGDRSRTEERATRRREQNERIERFARALRMARAAEDVSQTKLGEAVGVDASTISAWERGRIARIPPMRTIRQLEQALHLTHGELRRAAFEELNEGLRTPAGTVRYAAGALDPEETPLLRAWVASSGQPARPAQILVLPSGLTEEDVQLLNLMADFLAKARQSQSVAIYHDELDEPSAQLSTAINEMASILRGATTHERVNP